MIAGLDLFFMGCIFVVFKEEGEERKEKNLGRVWKIIFRFDVSCKFGGFLVYFRF